MTPLPQQKLKPFTPTADDDGNPTVCFCCGMRAVGIGVGNNPHQPTRSKDPGYLCKRCVVAIDDYQKIHRMDDYELKALDGGVDAVGEYIAEHGITDLSQFDELMQRMLVKAAWLGAVKRLRELLASGEAPF